jgi:hypothetical protein
MEISNIISFVTELPRVLQIKVFQYIYPRNILFIGGYTNNNVHKIIDFLNPSGFENERILQMFASPEHTEFIFPRQYSIEKSSLKITTIEIPMYSEFQFCTNDEKIAGFIDDINVLFLEQYRFSKIVFIIDKERFCSKEFCREYLENIIVMLKKYYYQNCSIIFTYKNSYSFFDSEQLTAEFSTNYFNREGINTTEIDIDGDETKITKKIINYLTQIKF